MPNNGDTSNYTSVFRLTPLGDPHRKVIKRNRQVVSCVPCRTRKLKCDRQQPCTSCVKRSDAVSCRFLGASGTASVGGHSPSVPRKQMQIRLQQLEDLVNRMITESGNSAAKDTRGATPSTEGPQLAVSASSRDEAVSPGQSSTQEQLGSEASNVRYAGGTSYAAVLECIHNLQEIVDEEAPDYLSASSQHLSLPGSQHEAREGQQQQEPVPAQSYGSATPLTAQQIMDCLPSRTECDKILTSYFQQVCKPYSVEAALLFVMHLVLQKRDTDPMCWHTFGTAIRLAQRMGYHRDPSYLNRNINMKISPFDAEMRRRTWFTLEWLDISFGFLLGIPPVVHGEDVDTQLPSNLRDEEFNEHSKSLPPSRPASDFTPVLSYIFYARQMQILRRIVRQAIAIAQPSYGDVISLDADLRSLHDDVPPNLRYRPIRESSFADAPDIIVCRMMLEIMHLKGMCVLHRRYLTLGRENAVYDRSREACRDASLKLLDLHAEFDQQSGDGGRLYEKRYMVTNAGLHVFLLAAMCLCLDLMASSGNSKQPFHDRVVSALKRARTIWGQTANASKESAHATKVLDTILTKVSPPERVLNPQNDDNNRYHAAAAAPASAKSPHSGSPSEQPDTPVSSWSAVNNKTPSTGTAVARRGFSVAWDFGMDAFHTERTKKRDSDDPIDMTVNGDIDWNELDSFILDREQIGSTTATSPVPPAADENPREGWPYIERGGRRARENWPYPQYDHNDGSTGSGTMSFRTWGRGGTTLGGFGFP
ncbi:hypothetical protein LA080_012389 [Diaporthe eres]|nr:hypothetical protein LA080_012389 [Diaporthe eres]